MNRGHAALLGLFSLTLAAASLQRFGVPTTVSGLPASRAVEAPIVDTHTIVGHSADTPPPERTTPLPMDPPADAAEAAMRLANVDVADTAAVTDAVSSADADARRTALGRLSNATTAPELSALTHAALHDRVVANRREAVDSLRLAALNSGDADGTIRGTLSLLVDDRDPRVAQSAREALNELEEIARTAPHP
jgi:hypothetical protein